MRVLWDSSVGEQIKVEDSSEVKSNTTTGLGEMNVNNKNYCYFRTAMLLTGFITMGISSTVIYTSIPDLRILFQTTVQELSFALAIGTLGSALGGPLAIFADKFESHSDLVISTSLLIAMVTFVSLPFRPNLWSFGLLGAVCNACWSWYQAASHGSISQMWGPRGEFVRYAMHFGYPVGAMLGPLLVLPFMSVVSSQQVSGNDTTVQVTFNYSSVDADIKDSQSETDIYIAYAICSGLIFLVMASFLCMYVFGPREAYLYKNTSSNDFNWKEILSPAIWAEGDCCFGIGIILSLFFFYLFMSATAIGTHSYLTTFLVDCDLNFTSKEAATLNSLTYGVGIFGRGLAILAVKYIHITHLIVIETHGLLLFGVLCLFVGTKYKTVMWVLVPCFGFFRETIWPAGYVWANNYIILFGVLVGLTDVVTALPTFFLVRLQGYLYTNMAIESVFYTTVGFGILLCVMVHVMNCFGRRHGDRKNCIQQVIRRKTYTSVNT